MTSLVSPATDRSTSIPGAQETGLKRRNIVLMIVFTIVSFGLYVPVWFLRRRAALNQLNAPRKLDRWPFQVIFAFLAVRLVVSLVAGPQFAEAAASQPLAGFVFSLVQLAVGILLVVQSFFVKDMLEDHLTGDAVLSSIMRDAATLSGMLTFFFSIFYLQHVINVRIVDAEHTSAATI